MSPSSSAKPFIVGLTGGIGSGKSTVAARLVERGCFLIDADNIAREIVEPGQPALAELAEKFQGILNADGTLNRAELARQAFATPEATAALNAATHPRIRARTDELFQQAEREGARVVVYDMPLLIENGETHRVDHVLVVDTPDDLRVERLVQHRGLDEEDARRRIAAQIGRAERLAAADTVLSNAGSKGALLGGVDRFFDDILARAHPGAGTEHRT
ncbi:dephospho-CoA kinase [Corynebacterium heidelbergense]|uniref:Dephospho-CoA kinase n=1 Tax=Corynebacterium heidelbergense TaxID=2055947 RepID=A0A364VAS7_9CORY|nr:dephospho-CoA kinase [Corynebacterium heidelbergense]RAV33737.1 dephospho-CoA kinase [Corynebacterium heidelbergense]